MLANLGGAGMKTERSLNISLALILHTGTLDYPWFV